MLLLLLLRGSRSDKSPPSTAELQNAQSFLLIRSKHSWHGATGSCASNYVSLGVTVTIWFCITVNWHSCTVISTAMHHTSDPHFTFQCSSVARFFIFLRHESFTAVTDNNNVLCGATKHNLIEIYGSFSALRCHKKQSGLCSCHSFNPLAYYFL